MISILLVRFDIAGYRGYRIKNVLITKDDRKREIHTWYFISNIHKVPSEKYIKRIATYGLTYVTDKNIIDKGGTILWKREVNYEL